MRSCWPPESGRVKAARGAYVKVRFGFGGLVTHQEIDRDIVGLYLPQLPSQRVGHPVLVKQRVCQVQRRYS